MSEMSELAFIYQLEQGQATPRLRPRPGSAAPWDDDDLQQLEKILSRQYADLNRGKVDTVTFKDRLLRVTVRQQKDNSRMPVIELTELPSPATGTGKPRLLAPEWLDGLLAEVERLAAEATDPPLDALEQALLRSAGEELRGLAGQVGPGGVGGLLLAGHLAAAEQVSRAADPARASVYGLALRGLDKLLARAGVEEARAGGRTGRAGNDVLPLAGVFPRLLRRLLGLPAAPASPL